MCAWCVVCLIILQLGLSLLPPPHQHLCLPTHSLNNSLLHHALPSQRKEGKERKEEGGRQFRKHFVAGYSIGLMCIAHTGMPHHAACLPMLPAYLNLLLLYHPTTSNTFLSLSLMPCLTPSTLAWSQARKQASLLIIKENGLSMRSVSFLICPCLCLHAWRRRLVTFALYLCLVFACLL